MSAAGSPEGPPTRPQSPGGPLIIHCSSILFEKKQPSKFRTPVKASKRPRPRARRHAPPTNRRSPGGPAFLARPPRPRKPVKSQLDRALLSTTKLLPILKKPMVSWRANNLCKPSSADFLPARRALPPRRAAPQSLRQGREERGFSLPAAPGPPALDPTN